MATEGPPPSVDQQNNISASRSNEDRVWERPWSVDEIRKSAGNWSLASDAGLLLHLQQFAQQMTAKVHELEKEVDGLVNDTKYTIVKGNNVINDFIMLANTQFVENRVYDEEVTAEEPDSKEKSEEKQEKTREQREAELIPKVKEALTFGINVIEQAFEKLDSHVADSDSEDDDDTGYRVDPILEAKDPYLSRPLPVMIGTPNFMQDDNVGLLEFESEDEESDHGSISESESESSDSEEEKSEEEKSYGEYSDSESDEENIKKPKPVHKPSFRSTETESESDDEELFGGKKKDSIKENSESGEEEEEEEEGEKQAPKGGAVDFASELAAKLGGPKRKTSEPTESNEDENQIEKGRHRSESTESKSKKKHKKQAEKHKKKEPKDDGLFGTGIQEDEEDSPFGKGGGLFSSGKGLFDDDEDDDDAGDLFKDDVNEPGRVSRKGTADESETVPPRKASNKSQHGGFFDDEDDDEDELIFAEKTKSKRTTSKEDSSSKKAAIFDDSEDDDMFSELSKPKNKEQEPSTQTQPSKPKLPAGAVPMFGGGSNPLADAIKKQRAMSQQSEENEWSEEERRSKSGSILSNKSLSSNKKPEDSKLKDSSIKKEASSNSLFNGTEDSLIFTPKSSSENKTKTKQNITLFDDDDDEEDDLFGIKSTPSAPVAKPKSVDTKPRAGSLFDDGDEADNLFGAPSPAPPASESTKKKPVGGVSIFGGLDIPRKQSATEVDQKKKTEEKPKTKEKAQISLFGNDDEDDNDDDMFSSLPSAKTTTSVPQKPKTSSKQDIFNDEDSLFDSKNKDGPGVDIFSSSPVKSNDISVSPQPNKVKIERETAKPIEESSNSGLFEEEKNDLFGSSTQEKEGKTLPVQGVTESETSDDKVMEEETVQEKQRKPVGGVSMFGGIDPFAARKNLKSGTTKAAESSVPDKVIKNVPEKKEIKPETKKQGLFGDEEEEDDFFPSNTKPTASPAAKSLFSPPPLDDFNDEDEDEDLFGTVQIPKTNISNLAPPKKESSVTSSAADGLFESSHPPLEEKKEEEKSTEGKPWRPAGAVSMFGGADLFGGSKSKVTPPEDIKKKPQETLPEPAQSPKSSSSPEKGKIGKLQMNLNFNPAAMLPGAAPPNREPVSLAVDFDKPAEVKTLHSANKDRAKIQSKRRPPSRRKVQSADDDLFTTPPISIPVSPENERVTQSSSATASNSDILPKLPIASSSSSKPDGVSDLFSDSSSHNVLSSVDENQVTKDKLSTPASKTALNVNDETDNLFSSTNLSKPQKKDSSGDDLFATTNVKPSKKAEKSALAVDEDDEDIFSFKPKTKASNKKERATSNENKSENKSSSDLFGREGSQEADDLFGSLPIKGNKVFSSVDDKENDIFAASAGKSKTTEDKGSDDLFNIGSTTPSTNTAKVEVDKDNEEDLFATQKPVKKIKKAPKTQDSDLFKDDTDIFADIPVKKTKEKKKSSAVPKDTGKSLFKGDQDLDDIFADTLTTPTSKPKKEKKKKQTNSKPATQSDNIFDDPLGI